MREPLLFDGLRRPAVRVIERREVIPRRPASGFGIKWQEELVIETSGNGRPYQVKFAEGWWRDLAELRIDDEARVLSFLQRRGDPFGELKPGSPIGTSAWLGLKLGLRAAAAAWEWRSDFEISRVVTLAGGSGFLRTFNLGWTDQLGVIYQGITPVLKAKTLAAYCFAAAAASLRSGLPMRRCDYCTSWFLLHYANARQCSASCRAARFNKRRSPHGFLPQDHDQEGYNPLAMPVERAGAERDVAGAFAELRDPEGSESVRKSDARDRKPRRRRPA